MPTASTAGQKEPRLGLQKRVGVGVTQQERRERIRVTDTGTGTGTGFVGIKLFIPRKGEMFRIIRIDRIYSRKGNIVRIVRV
jgi:hypothetical protein